MRQPHIKCDTGDISEWIIIPGDPQRIDIITKNWDTKKEVAYNREHRTVRGTYKDLDITCTSTGMGCPSASIAIEELTNIGAKGVIRIGTCGGLLPEMKSGDLIIPIAAMKSDGTTKEYVGSDYPAVADIDVVNALIKIAKQKKVRFFVGINRTHDVFYEPIENFTKLADINSKRLVSSEMECSAVFLVSDLRNIKSGAILVINTPEPPAEVKVDPSIVYKLADEEAVKVGMDNAVEITLEAIRLLQKKDIGSF